MVLLGHDNIIHIYASKRQARVINLAKWQCIVHHNAWAVQIHTVCPLFLIYLHKMTSIPTSLAKLQSFAEDTQLRHRANCEKDRMLIYPNLPIYIHLYSLQSICSYFTLCPGLSLTTVLLSSPTPILVSLTTIASLGAPPRSVRKGAWPSPRSF